ncbi:MAG: hypothetical protein ACK41W_17745, partial [Cyanobacteriota bacterium]
TLLTDPQRQPNGSCQVLLQTAGGRTELLLDPCRELREGWRARVSGVLERPASLPAAHGRDRAEVRCDHPRFAEPPGRSHWAAVGGP